MQVNLRVLIADDEKSSRDLIESYLSKYCTGLTLIGMAEDAKQAIEKINELKPDLVFLDVEMPFGNAFDVLENTEDINYQTIFTTAYSDYAIKALNYSAAYYILKPISIDEFVNAVEKVKEIVSSSNAALLKKALKDNFSNDTIKRIVLPNQNGFEIVNAEEIIRISGNGNYSDIHLNHGAKKTVSKVLKYFENLEQNSNFIRVHKSHIININFVSGYKKGRGGILIMSDQSEVEVSSVKKQAVLEALGLH